MQPITFNDVPDVLMKMSQKVDIMYDQLITQKTKPNEDPLMTIEELCEYLPGKPARQTVYGWVNNRLIEYEKHGSRLYFRKSNIDLWQSNGRQIKEAPKVQVAKRRVQL
jgi:hypothetical protein